MHGIKGACGYVGAQQLYKICDLMQEDYKNSNYDMMIHRYQSLVEAVIQFKRLSREDIANYKSK